MLFIFMATIVCRYDEIVHVACENKHKQSYILSEVKKHFPSFSADKKTHIFHEFASSTKIEMYAYYRSLGMSLKDSANACGLSHRIVEKMLNGEGIPLDVLVAFAKAEVFTKAEFKAKHLKNLETDEGKGAALQFLQTVYPKEYRKDAVINNLNITPPSTNPKQLMKDRGIPEPINELEDMPLVNAR